MNEEQSKKPRGFRAIMEWLYGEDGYDPENYSSGFTFWFMENFRSRISMVIISLIILGPVCAIVLPIFNGLIDSARTKTLIIAVVTVTISLIIHEIIRKQFKKNSETS